MRHKEKFVGTLEKTPNIFLQLNLFLPLDMNMKKYGPFFSSHSIVTERTRFKIKPIPVPLSTWAL
jgi:hypothetical protein